SADGATRLSSVERFSGSSWIASSATICVFASGVCTPSPRSGATASLLSDGTVLVAGGQRDSTPGSALASGWVVKYTGSSYNYGSISLYGARFNHAAIALSSGDVLLSGGTDTNGNPLSSTELIIPRSGFFTAHCGPNGGAGCTAGMSTARTGHALAALDSSHVLAIGGSNSGASAELWDLTTNTWQPVSSMSA